MLRDRETSGAGETGGTGRSWETRMKMVVLDILMASMIILIIVSLLQGKVFEVALYSCGFIFAAINRGKIK
jgi:hypothetical protein